MYPTNRVYLSSTLDNFTEWALFVQRELTKRKIYTVFADEVPIKPTTAKIINFDMENKTPKEITQMIAIAQLTNKIWDDYQSSLAKFEEKETSILAVLEEFSTFKIKESYPHDSTSEIWKKLENAAKNVTTASTIANKLHTLFKIILENNSSLNLERFNEVMKTRETLCSLINNYNIPGETIVSLLVIQDHERFEKLRYFVHQQLNIKIEDYKASEANSFILSQVMKATKDGRIELKEDPQEREFIANRVVKDTPHLSKETQSDQNHNSQVSQSLKAKKKKKQKAKPGARKPDLATPANH